MHGSLDFGRHVLKRDKLCAGEMFTSINGFLSQCPSLQESKINMKILVALDIVGRIRIPMA